MSNETTETRHRLLLKSDDEILEFVTGGKAIFTIKNRDTGNRATYRVESDGADGFVVYAFTGSDNALKGSYTVMGTMDADGFFRPRTAGVQVSELQAAISRKRKGHWVDNKPDFVAKCGRILATGGTLSKNMAYRFNGALRKYGISGFITDKMKLAILPWTWRQLTNGNGLPEQVEVWHEGCCRHCARRLTVPASIELGMGPDCAEAHGKYDVWLKLDRKLGRDLEAYAKTLEQNAA